jgi:hypothetical protein
MAPHRARGRFAPYVLGTALLALTVVLAAFAVGAAAAGEDPWGFAVAAAVAFMAWRIARPIRRLAAAARHFLMTHPRAAELPARFDVVAISGSDGENPPHWIRAAFDCGT